MTNEKKCSVCGRVMTDDECGDEFPEERVCDKCAGITPEVYGKCVHCEKPMTKLEAQQSQMGNEDWDNLTCDECFDAITLEIAKGAFPMVFSCDMSNTSCEMCEVVDCHRASGL